MFIDWIVNRFGSMPRREMSYQVYDGPLDGQWVNARQLDGYYLCEDLYSFRNYFNYGAPPDYLTLLNDVYVMIPFEEDEEDT